VIKLDNLNNKAVLVHGYNKNKKDMFVLKENLEEMGYDIFLAELPLLFKSVEYCTDLFLEQMEELSLSLDREKMIHLVGHSTGGIVIRKALNDQVLKKDIGRCVLISSPNKGSQLADLAAEFSSGFVNLFRTLKSITTANIENLNLKTPTGIDIGAIAGNNSNLLLGRLLKEENDGRIRVSSVKIKDLKDFAVVPYGHKDIHYKKKTAELVSNFLQSGKFKNY